MLLISSPLRKNLRRLARRLLEIRLVRQFPKLRISTDLRLLLLRLSVTMHLHFVISLMVSEIRSVQVLFSLQQ